ncbi:hypothetical protein K474DRAFT_1776547 [Panus rudis PR-1116 ss-1]|nr:hypothetical protein K474DRAFT_1776547 [Panus rudis PR-1116 ss-1]
MSVPCPSDTELRQIQRSSSERNEVIRQELTMIALEGRRFNELLPVAKLNTDILIEILRTAQASYEEEYQRLLTNFDYHTVQSHRSSGWLTITHVCHYWRTVALETPKLWTTLYFASPTWIRELLQRSRGASLKLCFVIPSYFELTHLQRMTSMKLALQALSRVEAIDLRIPGQYMNDVRNVAAGMDLGVLRRVVLYNLTENTADEDLFPPFSDCHISSLTHLAVARFPLRWIERFFVPTLTHLTLHTHERPSQSRSLFLIQPILKILPTLPRLTTLNINNIFKDSSLPDSPDHSAASLGATTIQLSELRELMISDYCGPTTHLISRLYVPSNCRIELHAAATSVTELETLSSAVVRLYERADMVDAGSQFSGIALGTTNYHGNPVVQFYANGASLYDRYWRDKEVKPLLSIRSTLPYHHEQFASCIDIIQHLCRPLHLPNVTQFHVGNLTTEMQYDGPTTPGSSLISEILEKTSSSGIEFLSIASSSFIYLPRMLHPLYEVKSFGGEEQVLDVEVELPASDIVRHLSPRFRNLKSLSLFHSSLTMWYWAKNALTMLFKALDSMGEAATSFTELRINGCECCTQYASYAHVRDLVKAFEDMCSKEGKFTSMMAPNTRDDDRIPHESRWNEEMMVLEDITAELEAHDWLWELRQGRTVTFDFRDQAEDGLTIRNFTNGGDVIAGGRTAYPDCPFPW